MDCLLKNGYSMLLLELLQEVIIGFCSDGASVILGTKSGVGKLLKDKFPDIILWHCLNHRLELMADVLNELTNLSEKLQSRNTTLPKAHTLLNAYTKRIESLIASPGEHSIMAEQA